jgi:N-acetyl-anhydromuramyl-L-alanine amidase AmpD
MQIDTTSYNKTRFPVGTGYDLRPSHRKACCVIVHTTNGKRGTAFESEARYLYASRKVSAHYLVGKSGQVVQFLPPDTHRAWHAGACRTPFENSQSIGIECHHAVGETWTVRQRAALTELVRILISRFNISQKHIETHRYAALPAGRKIDPSDWLDRDFYAWREALYITETDLPRSYRVRLDTQIGATVRAKPSATAERVMALSAGTIVQGRIVAGGTVTLPGFGTSNQWLQLTTDSYVWLPLLETIPG